MTAHLNPKFEALRNAIYHSSRRRFFELLTRTLSFLVVVSGTAAVAGLAWFEPKAAAAIAATIGALQLVFDFGGRARTHEMLQRKYYELLAEIEGVTTPSDQQYADWQSKLMRIYVDEPPPMRALDALAYNAACRSLGHDTTPKNVNWLEWALSHFYPFPNTDFNKPAKSWF